MSIPNEIPAVQRPAFFDGQRLTAADLSAVQDYQRELRWLHNRSLHTWGIAFGLEIFAKRGDRAVTVQIGYALDCLGRDLLVNAAVSLPIPPVAGPTTFYLTISYIEDEDLPPELRRGECDANGAVRLPEQARLRWQQPDDHQEESLFRHGYDLILASIQVQNCKLAAEPVLKQRREARPATQPYIAAGRDSSPAWETIKSGKSGTDVVVGLRVAVDTSAAGFGATPQYMAHVVGNRSPTDDIVIDGLTTISGATPVSFTLTLYLPPDIPMGDGMALNSSKLLNDGLPKLVQDELGWSIAWLGIEG